MKHRFKNLKVWQQGMELVTEIYRVSKEFPDYEKFGLISQIRRSAVSFVSNIAEGTGRGSEKDFNLFLGYALGSLFELETQLIISKNLNFLSETDFISLSAKVEEIQRMTIGFKEKVSLSKV